MGDLVNPEFDFEKRYRLVREVIETAVLTLVMFLIIRFAVQNYFVDGTSMEPNLHNQERILVDKWTYQFHSPARGDIIVFIAPPDPSQDYVKRIIGIPGDVITINETTVIVDGVTLQERYVDPRRQGNPYDYKTIHDMVVPPGNYFVLGDNRDGSSDSRDWGFVPRQNIIGRASLVYWPFGQDNDGLIPNVSYVFANVHQIGKSPSTHTDGNSFDADGMLLIPLSGSIVVCSRRRNNGLGQRRLKWWRPKW